MRTEIVELVRTQQMIITQQISLYLCCRPCILFGLGDGPYALQLKCMQNKKAFIYIIRPSACIYELFSSHFVFKPHACSIFCVLNSTHNVKFIISPMFREKLLARLICLHLEDVLPRTTTYLCFLSVVQGIIPRKSSSS